MWPLSERGCMRADFGFSISAMHSVAQTEVGTPNYCAPEVLMRATMDACYDGKKADGAHWQQRADAAVCAHSSVLGGPFACGFVAALAQDGAVGMPCGRPCLHVAAEPGESCAASMPLCCHRP